MGSTRHNRCGCLLVWLLTVVLSAAAVAQEESTPPESAPAASPVDPERVRLYLVDGSVITGKFSISQITVDTQFGKLEIPIAKLRKVVPGLASHPEMSEKIESLIEQLGSHDKQQCEAAQQELLDLGPAVLKQIELFRHDSNPQRAQHVETILEKLEELAVQIDEEFEDSVPQPWIHDDTVETTQFTVIGTISPENFTFASQFGTLSVRLADIQSVQCLHGVRRSDVRKSLVVDGNNLAQLRYKSTRIRLQRGDRVTVQADGMISRGGSTSYQSSPDGNSRFGHFSQNPAILGGTLVAKIGSGDAMKIGSKRTFTATRSGVLQFAIGMRPDYVSRYQFPGQYNLKVRVDRANPQANTDVR